MINDRPFLDWLRERIKNMRLDDKEGIEEAFTYHLPSEEQKVVYNELRNQFKELALSIIEKVPSSATRTVALRKLWEASMITNAAIATEGKI